ncbi:2,3-dihydroxybiphenyl 1,2-dioxygenase [Bacillus sp. AFS076308]|uniref:VOC family protein n=1 Tax=unclassified Bacillus (in: firmicutes) TaxID=185979 RepID=UPI000BF5A7A1|nr:MULTISPECIES: VOC family protein [unclassified Bacillus (in: firmicutes)]PFO08690.1 2,3-dihydroxybiphenyl 1,2-dioxygenase [Bacillus sp. AFS076308]PGV49885.1 2,3-dihydroxybiphenyl 1,2-dioxygenase [Bacillus sp. AFS037270]
MEKFHYAPEIAKLGHVALVSADLEKSLWFFRDTIGLEETEVVDGVHYLRAWGDFEHHTLSITAGETSYIDHIGWRTKRREDIATFAKLLEDAGTEVRWIEAGEEVAQGEAICFELPSGHRFELYYDMEKTPADESRKSVLKNQTYKSWAKGVSPRRIDHVNLQTSHDNAEIVKYLQEALGFKLREYFVNPDDVQVASWLSVTNLVHDVAIMSTSRSKEPNEMHHIAYWLDNAQDLLRAADILCEADVQFVGPGKHGISQAMYIYVKDPGSGLRLEIFTNGYLIFEPDWEPVKWTYEEYLKNGSAYWGDRRRDDVDREEQVKELARS